MSRHQKQTRWQRPGNVTIWAAIQTEGTPAAMSRYLAWRRAEDQRKRMRKMFIRVSVSVGKATRAFERFAKALGSIKIRPIPIPKVGVLPSRRMTEFNS